MTVSAPGRARPVTPMALIVDALDETLERLDHLGPTVPGLAGVRDAVRRAHDLAAGVDPYLELHAGEESPALAELARGTAAHDWTAHPGDTGLEQEMLSGHVEGRLLAMLARATGARRVLEIGMFTGYSALALAEAVPDDGVVVACEVDPAVAELARAWFAASPAGERIEVRVGPALDTLAGLAAHGERFDLVFVDADKAGYLDYLNALLDDDLLAPGALVCVDNTLMQGQPWLDAPHTANGAAVAEFNRAVLADPRVDQVILPLRDGLTLIRRHDVGHV